MKDHGGAGLVLNVAPVSLSVDTLQVGRLQYTDDNAYRELREDHWRTHSFRFDSRTGEVLNVALRAGTAPLGEVGHVPVRDHLLLAAKAVQHRLLLALAGGVPILKGGSKRLVFLGRVDDSLLLSKALKRAGLPPVEGLEVPLRYELDCRLFSAPDGEQFLGLVIDVGTLNVIDIPASGLLKLGVRIEGQYVVRRREDEYHGEYPVRPGLEIIGRVAAAVGGRLELVDSRGLDSVDAADVLLEPRTENLHAVISATCGARTERVLESLAGMRSGVSTPKGKLDRIRRTLATLQRQSLVIGDGVALSLGELVAEGNDHFPERISTERPTLLFGPRGTNTDTMPDRGIRKWGPYKYLQHERNAPVLAIVCEGRYRGRVEQIMNLLCNGIAPEDWKGPGLNAFPAGLITGYRLPKPKIEIEEVTGSGAQDYAAAVQHLLRRLPRPPDIAFIQTTDAAKRLPAAEDPYLVSKAALMTSGVVSQGIRMETIESPAHPRGHALRGLACATYAKLDGTPWVVSTRGSTTHELVLGIGLAEARETRLSAAERFVGITTVFQGDGRYLVWGLTREVTYEEYPGALLESLRTAVRYVREQDDWEQGDKVRLVFHVYKSLKRREIEATKALVRELLQDSFAVEFAFLDISSQHPYLIFDTHQAGKSYQSGTRLRGQGLPERGTCLQLDNHRALLHLTGPNDIKTPDQGLPRPLLVELHGDSDFTDLVYLMRQVYHFTYASWQSTMPASEPVTIKYSRMIARLLGNLTHVPSWNSAPVTTGTLRGRAWFL